MERNERRMEKEDAIFTEKVQQLLGILPTVD